MCDHQSPWDVYPTKEGEIILRLAEEGPTQLELPLDLD